MSNAFSFIEIKTKSVRTHGLSTTLSIAVWLHFIRTQ